jgi:PAS domain-containing protein
MKRNRTGGRAVEPLLESIWPFLALVIVLVALALMDFLFVEPAHASRLLLLVLRIAASIALLMLAGVTLRRLFIERSRLAEALTASEQRLVSSLSDIQRRTQAEALLFEEKERAQVTLASIADAVVTVDTAGRIEFLNPVAERLTGWPLDEARQRPVADVFAVVDEATGAPIADPVGHALTDGAVIEADGNVVLLCRGAEGRASE